MKTSILNHHIISERYFFPEKESFENPYFIDCKGIKLSCYYQNKYPDSKTVIYFHGNGETVGDYIGFFTNFFENEKINLLIFEFRGYGMSTGRPEFVSMLSDVECVINHLNLKQSKLVFYGRSVGTIYAVHAASKFPHADSLILESGVADVKERILLRLHAPSEINSTKEEIDNELDKHFNTKEKLSKFKGKSLVLHTVNDHILDVSHGKKLYEYLSEPKDIHLFKRGNHNTIFMENQKKYFELLFDFIHNHKR